MLDYLDRHSNSTGLTKSFVADDLVLWCLRCLSGQNRKYFASRAACIKNSDSDSFTPDSPQPDICVIPINSFLLKIIRIWLGLLESAPTPSLGVRRSFSGSPEWILVSFGIWKWKGPLPPPASIRGTSSIRNLRSFWGIGFNCIVASDRPLYVG